MAYNGSGMAEGRVIGEPKLMIAFLQAEAFFANLKKFGANKNGVGEIVAQYVEPMTFSQITC